MFRPFAYFGKFYEYCSAKNINHHATYLENHTYASRHQLDMYVLARRFHSYFCIRTLLLHFCTLHYCECLYYTLFLQVSRPVAEMSVRLGYIQPSVLLGISNLQ